MTEGIAGSQSHRCIPENGAGFRTLKKWRGCFECYIIGRIIFFLHNLHLEINMLCIYNHACQNDNFQVS